MLNSVPVFPAPAPVREGEPLGKITLIAVITGVIVALIILILLRMVIRRKDPEDQEKDAKGKEATFNNLAFSLADESPNPRSVTEAPEKNSSPT